MIRPNLPGLYEPARSLREIKARVCDCGNPVCFGTLHSADVAWLVRRVEQLQRKVRRG